MSTQLIYKQMDQMLGIARQIRSVLDDTAGQLTGATPPPDGKPGPSAVSEPPLGFIPTVVCRHDEIIECLVRAHQFAEYLQMSVTGPASAPESVMTRSMSGALGTKDSNPMRGYGRDKLDDYESRTDKQVGGSI